MNKLFEFLNELEKRIIYYRLDRHRDSIMVDITVPGQKWEIEFMEDGSIEIEKFISSGMYDESEIEVLFRDFSEPE